MTDRTKTILPPIFDLGGIKKPTDFKATLESLKVKFLSILITFNW